MSGLVKGLKKVPCKVQHIRLVAVSAMMCLLMSMTAFAAEVDGGLDVAATLSTSFQKMADQMLATITAVLPVVLSVMAAMICIQFGIKFFKKFTK